MSQTQVQTSGITNGSVTPAKLSTGSPTWTTGGVVSATSFSGPLTGNATSATTASSCSGIVYAQGSSNSINLTLPSGTWVVEFFYTARLTPINNLGSSGVPDASFRMSIDGVVIYSSFQDRIDLLFGSASPYIPLFGIVSVSGGRTINCIVETFGDRGTTPATDNRRSVVKAIRIA
jgi:hypothetical protein